jgi:hypothetical protein
MTVSTIEDGATTTSSASSHSTSTISSGATATATAKYAATTIAGQTAAAAPCANGHVRATSVAAIAACGEIGIEGAILNVERWHARSDGADIDCSTCTETSAASA